MGLLDKIRGKLRENEETALIRRAEHDLDDLNPRELRRLARILETRQAQADLRLTELQTQDTMFSLRSHNREALVEQYLAQMEALNLKTPGGLRSARAEPGEDPELVDIAWRRFCDRRRGGGGRLG
jgi:hypothetical protein